MLVKPADTSTKDLLSIRPQLGKEPCPVLDYFNNVCPHIDYLEITRLEYVQMESERKPRVF